MQDEAILKTLRKYRGKGKIPMICMQGEYEAHGGIRKQFGEVIEYMQSKYPKRIKVVWGLESRLGTVEVLDP